MPHRAVYLDDKGTSKVRVVFDASVHAPGFESLNEQLHCGDNLIPDLLQMLLNFRIGAIGVTADIEKAFLQISINDNDRDVLRFLWYKDPVPENLTSAMEQSNITTYRMKRVTFGIISSPFLLAATLRKHFEDQPEKLQNTASILSKSFYVDDLVTAASTLDEAQNLYSESMQILQAANMNLRKWRSNDATMMAVFQTNEKVTRQGERKVLGILWHTLHDELGVSVQSEEEDTVPTKRKVLKTVAKIYDPLGLLGPCTVKSKILLQTLWKKKLNWDDVLDPEQSGEWSKWCKELNDLSELRVPRCIIQNKRDKVDLHIFADASPYAYGAVAYIRCLSNSECNYVMSKNRVAPIDKSGQRELTLPKLELTAALCAARLQNYIAKNMLINIQKTTLWSDSKTSLYWIRGKSKKWKPYVQNRVNEIHKLSDSVWRYCPGKENPADLLTRGISAKTLIDSNLWLRGPKWLNDEENWPSDEYFEPDVDQVSSFLTIQRNESTPETQPIFPLEKYGIYEKIMRITAYVIRFIKLTKKMYKSKRLSTQDLNEADTYWIKYIQEKDFPNELKALKRGMPIQSSSSILMLKPFLDENGVMRLLGRLDEAPLSYDEKHPIILPKRSMLTEKIIRKCHERVNHYGVNATLAELRKRFWVPQGRQKVKAILNQCLKCKRLKGKPGNEECAPLPKTRVTMTNPFNITGIDFAGPLYANVAGQRTKTYIMLFTCAVIRAVHLELVPDLTTECCIRGLRRFIARRGVPDVVYSDNAKTFKRTDLELRKLSAILESEKIQDLVRKHRIHWRFIAERAPWWGGFWERMVKTVKDALKITLGRAYVERDELETILIEIEATINSRPLTYISDDSTDLTILSPSHFLTGRTEVGFCMNLTSKEISRSEILKRWRDREKTLKRFWDRWRSDYLQQLRTAHLRKSINAKSLNIGDVVLVQELV
nr:uncharacterized protein LOC111415413 [Onthophagus taurus]